MNARTISQANQQTTSVRFDRKFIEDHKLVERVDAEVAIEQHAAFAVERIGVVQCEAQVAVDELGRQQLRESKARSGPRHVA